MIEFKNVKKSFNKNEILKNISFCINTGDLVKISGSNGCGKSTLLKIATSLIKPDSGIVRYDNIQENIGALIENPYFIENETGYYNLKFLYCLKNKSTFDINKLKKIMYDFDLDPNLNMPVKKYSVGMRQKLGIIQAIMENQNIIYLDEPTRGLDKKSVEYFYKIIHKLHENKKTIVICSHEDLLGVNFNHEYIIENGYIIEKE